MTPTSLGGINRLPSDKKREIYIRLIPPVIFERYGIKPEDLLETGKSPDLFDLRYPKGSSSIEASLFHKSGYPDPVLYAHMTDTLNGKIRVLLYVVNDPESLRIDVDRLPDGTPTKFGTEHRNLTAELLALEAGYAPGQIYRGLRVFKQAMESFEIFLGAINHDVYFIEPLYYHTAVIFEKHGFAYEGGKQKMIELNNRFLKGGDLYLKLDESTPFRSKAAHNSIRLRSWAIQDGILGEPFTHISMYKLVGKRQHVNTRPGIAW